MSKKAKEKALNEEYYKHLNQLKERIKSDISRNSDDILQVQDRIEDLNEYKVQVFDQIKQAFEKRFQELKDQYINIEN